MRVKYFVLIGIGFIPIFFTIYLLLYFFQLNASVGADYWISNAYKYKDYRAKSIQSKKIIIIGGSNALFGINSEIIQRITGYPVLNLAMHAGLDMDYFYYKVKQHIKKEDIVVMPLEFTYYTQGDDTTNLFSNNMMSWGRNYLYQLSLTDFLKFFLVAEPDRVLVGAMKQIETKGKNLEALTQKKVVDSLQEIWSKEGEKWRGYSYKSLNHFGDVNVNLPVDNKTGSAYLNIDQNVSLHFLKVYTKIDRLVKENRGKLYLTYPVTMKTEKFDLSTIESRLKVDNLERSLNELNIKLYCNPALFNLDVGYFFNTDYHPNMYGALVRSENLATCLNRVENTNKERRLSFEEAIETTLVLQDKYAGLLKELKN